MGRTKGPSVKVSSVKAGASHGPSDKNLIRPQNGRKTSLLFGSPEAMVADARWPPIPVRPSIIRGAGSRQAENRRRSEERLRA